MTRGLLMPLEFWSGRSDMYVRQSNGLIQISSPQGDIDVYKKRRLFRKPLQDYAQ